jgi:hypothetical protein
MAVRACRAAASTSRAEVALERMASSERRGRGRNGYARVDRRRPRSRRRMQWHSVPLQLGPSVSDHLVRAPQPGVMPARELDAKDTVSVASWAPTSGGPSRHGGELDPGRSGARGPGPEGLCGGNRCHGTGRRGELSPQLGARSRRGHGACDVVRELLDEAHNRHGAG